MPGGERPAPVEDDRPDRHARMVCGLPAAGRPAAGGRCYGCEGGWGIAGGMSGPADGDQAGTGDRARLVFTIRMMKITISVASPARTSSTPPTMLATRPPPKLSPHARSLPAGRLVPPGVSTVNRPG